MRQHFVRVDLSVSFLPVFGRFQRHTRDTAAGWRTLVYQVSLLAETKNRGKILKLSL